MHLNSDFAFGVVRKICTGLKVSLGGGNGVPGDERLSHVAMIEHLSISSADYSELILTAPVLIGFLLVR